jgi:hypothetical protein
MKHEIEMFAPNGTIAHDYNDDNGEMFFAAFMGFILPILINLIHLFGAIPGNADGQPYDPILWHLHWIVPIATIIFPVVFWGIVPLLIHTHRGSALDSADKKAAYKKFLALEPETQVRLGGKNRFYESLIQLDEKGAREVLNEIVRLSFAQEKAIKARTDQTVKKELISDMRREREALEQDAKITTEVMEELS